MRPRPETVNRYVGVVAGLLSFLMLATVDAELVRPIAANRIVLTEAGALPWSGRQVKKNSSVAVEFDLSAREEPFESAYLYVPIGESRRSATDEIDILTYAGDGTITGGDYFLGEQFSTVNGFTRNRFLVDITGVVDSFVANSMPFLGVRLATDSTRDRRVGGEFGMESPVLIINPSIVPLEGGWEALLPNDSVNVSDGGVREIQGQSVQFVDTRSIIQEQSISVTPNLSQCAHCAVPPITPIIFRQSYEGATKSIAINNAVFDNESGLSVINLSIAAMSNTERIMLNKSQTLASGGEDPFGFSTDPMTNAFFYKDFGGEWRLQAEDHFGWQFPADEEIVWGGGDEGGHLWIDTVPLENGKLQDFAIEIRALVNEPKPKIVPEPVGLPLWPVAFAGSLIRRRRRL